MTQAERLQKLREMQNPSMAALLHIQMLKGDDGHTPTEQELIAIIRPLIPTPEDILRRIRVPNDGYTPTNEEIIALIKPLIPEVKDGHTPTKSELRRLIIPLIPPPEKGEPGISPAPIQPQTIIDAVMKELAVGLTLEPKHIKGLGDKIKNLDDLIAFLKAGGFRGGQGTTTVVGGAPFAETVSGTIDGVNVTFTVPTTIVKAQALYLANSVYQPMVDFTTSGTTITMTVAPDISLAGQPFWLLHT